MSARMSPCLAAGTALIDVLAQLGLHEEALDLLADLRSHGVRISARSYNAILHALAEEVKLPRYLALLHLFAVS